MFPNTLSTDFYGNENPYRNSMRSMDQMMNSVFGDFSTNPMASMMMPFGGGMFGNFGSLMNNMNNLMAHGAHGAHGGDGSQSFCSSTFMSYSSNGPNGQPQVYKASSSTRTGPGGIKETKKSVSDSRTGVKKMAIGHHIGDRAHIVERQQNVYSGEQEENQEYINLDDNEADEFNNEWRNKAQNMNSHRSRYLPYTHSDVLAIEGHQEQGRKRSAKQKTPKKIHQYPVNDA